MGLVMFYAAATLLMIGFVAQAFEHAQRPADSRKAVAEIAFWRADLHPSPQIGSGFLRL